ncbi:hypothetical protein [Kangiella sp. HZ709]|uniref:hypothetical protein n=1 Tax=Kangiella sp. HZ709 TaxID=2666328 RepID=UPI0012B11BB5|nr:hypothetical protein [Kangiella sp. HZ709]MRX27335.1 hypothetical protein [Kangiella sp. HZ709]
MRIIPKNPFLRVLLSGTLAFLSYGAWGYIANSDAGHDIALRSGLVQGGMSFLLTFVGSAIMEFMVRLSKDNLKRFLMAVITNLTAVYSFIIIGHLLNGTPNIFLSILPGLIITCIYCFSYSWFLTFGHAAGGDYKMVQLVKVMDSPKLLDAQNLIAETTTADPIQAKRVIDDIEMGRKSSLYVNNFEQQTSLIESLHKLGIKSKPL